jgi:phage shock protein E|uniref:rhodanese-like domain-containing protein n=1 Tax=Candidatus Planktophila sp. TaxID=2175601 RepID=UPI00404B70EC
MKKVVAALFISALFLTGCSSTSASVSNLGATEFLEKASTKDVVLIDVRTPGEFAEGNIVNALNIDVQSSSFDSQIAQLDPTKTYALYCRSGNRSGIAAEKMADAGFTYIYNATVGFTDLAAAGAPTA